jgi:hypothetical protein
MCALFNLEVRHKRPKQKGITSNLHKFWSQEVQRKKHPKKKKTFVFECHNLMDPMELGVVIF